jgi:hypothetical protein
VVTRSAVPFLGTASEGVIGDVSAPDLSKRVGDLAAGGTSSQGILHGQQDVVSACRGCTQTVQRTRRGFVVAVLTQHGKTFALVGLGPGSARSDSKGVDELVVTAFGRTGQHPDPCRSLVRLCRLGSRVRGISYGFSAVLRDRETFRRFRCRRRWSPLAGSTGRARSRCREGRHRASPGFRVRSPARGRRRQG